MELGIGVAILFDGMGSAGEWAGALASIVSIFLSGLAIYLSHVNSKSQEKLQREMDESKRIEERELVERQRAFDIERDERDQQYRDWMKDNDDRRRVIEEKRQERELLREARDIARSISAWWAIRKQDGQWGLRLSNDGASAGTLRQVKIVADANGPKWPLELDVLPPGHFFVPSIKPPNGFEKTGWEFSQMVVDRLDFDPILNAKTHRVERIQFEDAAGTAWCWTPREGLTQC